MELKKGPLSFWQLLADSLKVANRSFGSAVALFGFVFVITLLVGGVMALATWLFHKYALILTIPLSLCLMLLNMAIPLALIQIIASKAEKTGMGAWDSLTSSVIPTIYFIISTLILSAAAALIIGGALLTKSTVVVSIVYVALSFAMLPFLFVQHILVLKAEGPVSALQGSWHLASAHYVRILLYLFGISALCFGGLLGLLCLLKFLGIGGTALAVKMQLLMLPKLYLVAGAIIFLGVYLFGFLTLQAFVTLLFLNLDYCHRHVKTREHDTPIVQAAVGITDPMELATEVKVKQASIETPVDENTFHHLDKVYSPQEHLSQATQQEEDRLPTILFDDEMAQKLAALENKEKQQSQDEPQDEGPSSIKRSEDSL